MAVVAVIASRITILGNCPADIVIEKMAIDHDENWGKYWALSLIHISEPTRPY